MDDDRCLRKQWGFNGFVVTDYASIAEILQHGTAKTSGGIRTGAEGGYRYGHVLQRLRKASG